MSTAIVGLRLASRRQVKCGRIPTLNFNTALVLFHPQYSLKITRRWWWRCGAILWILILVIFWGKGVICRVVDLPPFPGGNYYSGHWVLYKVFVLENGHLRDQPGQQGAILASSQVATQGGLGCGVAFGVFLSFGFLFLSAQCTAASVRNRAPFKLHSCIRT
jgi:hypothetical protein